MGQIFAYKRVSTVAQSTVRQLDGLSFDREFIDKVSGASAERPQLRALLGTVRKSDLVIVDSIDRLARNLGDLLVLINQLTSKGVSIKFRKEALEFSGEDSPMATMQLQIIGAVAQFERSIINERAAEGRVIAMANGVLFGRKPSLTKKEKAEVLELRNAGKSVKNISLDFDVSRQVIYRVLKEAA